MGASPKFELEDNQRINTDLMFDGMKILGGGRVAGWESYVGTNTVDKEPSESFVKEMRPFTNMVAVPDISDFNEWGRSYEEEQQFRNIITRRVYNSFLISRVRDESEEIVSLDNILNDLHNELDEVYKECHEIDWDGYGAEKIGLNVYSEAKKLLGVLISVVPSRVIASIDISPAADGSIVFEWRKDEKSILTISTSGKEEVVVAFINEYSKSGVKVRLDRLREYLSKVENLFFK